MNWSFFLQLLVGELVIFTRPFGLRVGHCGSALAICVERCGSAILAMRRLETDCVEIFREVDGSGYESS